MHQLEAARIMNLVSKWHQSREYLHPGMNLADFAKRFCSDKKYSEVAYCWSFSFDPTFFAHLCYEGFLSICSYPSQIVYTLMPWIDPERCVMDLDSIHISKKVLKRSNKYSLTVNKSFQQVIDGCIAQHGESWLHLPMRALLKSLNSSGYSGEKKNVRFAVHSIELWDDKKLLVAGDIGYTVGGCYTSMTGFRKEGTVSAGTIQLVATCGLLKEVGFQMWDLGMVMKYKKDLGATVLKRQEFIKRFHVIRDETKAFLKTPQAISARRLIKSLKDSKPPTTKTSANTSNSSAAGAQTRQTRTLEEVESVTRDKKS
uniref:Leucyl/phenylalanyl-tRNA--protein transferase n=1 Tax=Amorphochlora amoebiformis TaxID=1561963 RepID=A0A7S0H6V6_9EUKA